MTFSTVTVAGGTGILGYNITEALLNDGYKVKVLRRKPESENEKASKLASKGAEIVYADYSQKDDLVKALKGTDALISVVSSDDLYAIQSKLIAAAKEANVKRVIPSEFGNDYRPGVHVVTDGKAKIREELEKSGLEYTFIYTGIFPEYFDFFGFDIKNKKATFCVDKNSKVTATSIPDAAKYTVESLKLPAARNAAIHVSGATLTLNEYLQLYEKASGSKWELVEDKDVRHRFKNNIEPVPSIYDDLKVVILEAGPFEKVDNDKFSFTPRPISAVIDSLVKQA